MENHEDIIKTLKAQLYDASQDINTLRNVIGAIAQNLGVDDQASTFQDVIEASAKAAVVEEV